jgi:hypothetical protein
MTTTALCYQQAKKKRGGVIKDIFDVQISIVFTLVPIQNVSDVYQV